MAEKKILSPGNPEFFGVAAGADFPVGTRLEKGKDEQTLWIVTPDKKRRAVTHDIIRSAKVLCMGECEIEPGKREFAAKYRLELTDGTEAILTVPARFTERVEHALF